MGLSILLLWNTQSDCAAAEFLTASPVMVFGLQHFGFRHLALFDRVVRLTISVTHTAFIILGRAVMYGHISAAWVSTVFDLYWSQDLGKYVWGIVSRLGELERVTMFSHCMRTPWFGIRESTKHLCTNPRAD
jgi:hypothetical protein